MSHQDRLLQLYLRGAGQYSVLTAEEERKLARLVGQGDQVARERFIHHNLRLVVSVARGYRNRGLSFLDLIGWGNVGLLEAVRRFDPGRGFRFSTYASWWIRQAILQALSTSFDIARQTISIEDFVSRSGERIELDRLIFLAASRLEETESSQDSTAGRLAQALRLKLDWLVATRVVNLEHYRVFLILYGLDGNGGKTISQTAELCGYTPKMVGNIKDRILGLLRQELGQKAAAMTARG